MSLIRVLETKQVRQYVLNLYPSMRRISEKQADDAASLELFQTLFQTLYPHAFRTRSAPTKFATYAGSSMQIPFTAALHAQHGAASLQVTPARSKLAC